VWPFFMKETEMTGFVSNQQAQSDSSEINRLRGERLKLVTRQNTLQKSLNPLNTKLARLLKDKRAAVASGNQAKVDNLTSQINDLNIERKPYLDAIDQLTKDIEAIDEQIDFLRTPGTSASVRHEMSADQSFDALNPFNSLSSSGGNELQGRRTDNSGQLKTPNPMHQSHGTEGRQSTVPPAFAIPGYNEKPQARAHAQILYPDLDKPQPKTPMLVRRDGQGLSHGEILYPELSYDEDTYELWPDHAINKANKLYPHLKLPKRGL
jgi:hypothetical protein